MPAYCEHLVTFSSSNKRVLTRIARSIAAGQLCSDVIPLPPKAHAIPDDYLNPNARHQLSNWGTMCDIVDPQITYEVDDVVQAHLLTAWSSPWPVFDALQQAGVEMDIWVYEHANGMSGESFVNPGLWVC